MRNLSLHTATRVPEAFEPILGYRRSYWSRKMLPDTASPWYAPTLPDDEKEEALHWLAQLIKENWA